MAMMMIAAYWNPIWIRELRKMHRGPSLLFQASTAMQHLIVLGQAMVMGLAMTGLAMTGTDLVITVKGLVAMAMGLRVMCTISKEIINVPSFLHSTHCMPKVINS